MKEHRMRGYQRGAATLLVALVLMISITVVTLTVANTQLFEQKISANQNWYTRLSLQAATGMAAARRKLDEDFNQLQWTHDRSGGLQFSRLPVTGTDPQIASEVILRRVIESQDFIEIESTAWRRDGFTHECAITEHFRALSVLSPLAEQAPPLVANGCIDGEPADFQLRPLHADSDRAGDAAWLNADLSCPPPAVVDTHHGDITARTFAPDLWSDFFTADRETFMGLSEIDRQLPATRRIYHVAGRGDLTAGRWSRSLGNPSHHIILYIPREFGCPEFAAGVQLFGLVFIDADCPRPLTRQHLEINGSLVVNGAINLAGASLQLNHIQHADPRFSRLNLPVLLSVRVPGSWRDF